MSKSAPAKRPATQIIKLVIPAAGATPSPPIGPALGSKGVKSIDFCKEFNALTQHMQPGTPIPARISVRPDRSFSFTLRAPPTATLLLSAAGVGAGKGGKVRGANAPGRLVDAVGAAVAAAAAQPAGEGVSVRGKGAASAAEGAETEVGRGVVKLVSREAGKEKPAGQGGGTAQVGTVSLKHVYEIAKVKQREDKMAGLPLEGIVRSVVAQARSVGVGVVP